MLHREWRMKERYPEPVIDVKALETAAKCHQRFRREPFAAR